MKVHYINILLFVIPLNILINDQRNHKSTTPHTPKIPTTRLLCECDIYTSIYDNDPQMKAVMENYNRQTSDRFKEYDERMKTTRQKCKDKCDKEIEKIILKDKMEKELMDKFATLHTDIQSDAIPTCVCEKSLADKTEKFCLNCSKNMGAIAPWWGLVCGTGYAGWSHYVPIAVAKAAMDAGMNVVINVLKKLGAEKVTAVIFKEISSTGNYANIIKFSRDIYAELTATCAVTSSSTSDGAMRAGICSIVKNVRAGVVPAQKFVSNAVKGFAEKAKLTANTQAAEVTTTYKSITSTLTNTIIASIIAIVIIVLIMVIIYLILHYRRKKKMKKKLQYIKLLEE
ncbi:rifin [Plasmodium falciparum RAJ116]|uniref:Rifin n=1 Tax=Plasmodium falciparum RAJ116 TaxID=580058 RepID=A0A0L0CS39_PLAFA|nr:rifin [Plasmodium falciparum RAJ116]